MTERKDEQLHVPARPLTPDDFRVLEEEGITLEQALSYDQPTEAEIETVATSGVCYIGAILMTTNVKLHLYDALSKVDPLAMLLSMGREISQERIEAAQEMAIGIIEPLLSGNPYPGRDFTLEKGRAALSLMKSTRWNSSNLASSLQQIRDAILPPKPQSELPSEK